MPEFSKWKRSVVPGIRARGGGEERRGQRGGEKGTGGGEESRGRRGEVMKGGQRDPVTGSVLPPGHVVGPQTCTDDKIAQKEFQAHECMQVKLWKSAKRKEAGGEERGAVSISATVVFAVWCPFKRQRNNLTC